VNATDLPAVSIGIPTFNGGHVIGDAVASALSQSFRDIEVIVSDNASSDDTPDVLAALAARDSRLRIIRQPVNLGPSGNFKAVLAASRAPLFMWLADDDRIAPDWLERLVPIARRPGTIAFGAVQLADAAWRPRRHYVNGRDLSFTGPALLRRIRYATEPAYLGKANPIYGLFPRAALNEQALEIFQDAAPWSDVLLLYHLLRSHEIVCDTGALTLAGSGIVRPPASPDNAPRQPPRRRRFFKRTHLPDLLALSDWRETVILLALLPVTTLRFELQKLSRKRCPSNKP